MRGFLGTRCFLLASSILTACLPPPAKYQSEANPDAASAVGSKDDANAVPEADPATGDIPKDSSPVAAVSPVVSSSPAVSSSPVIPQVPQQPAASAVVIPVVCPSKGNSTVPLQATGANGLAFQAPLYNLLLDISHRPAVTYKITKGSVSSTVVFSDGLKTEILRNAGQVAYTDEQTAQALSYMPWGVRKHVRHIDFRSTYPGGGNTAAEAPYGKDGTIFVYPPGFNLSVGRLGGMLSHESGHSLLNETFSGGQEPWISYEKAAREEAVAPSQYAKEGRGQFFEDFAETTELYIDIVGTPSEKAYRALMPRRFAFMDMVKPDRSIEVDPCAGK